MDVRICNPPPRAFDLVSAAVLATHHALSKADRALSRFCGRPLAGRQEPYILDLDGMAKRAGDEEVSRRGSSCEGDAQTATLVR